MPGMNRTGPLGEGPMTGRGAGPCAGSGRSGSMHSSYGGWAGGRGRGGGRRFAGGGQGWRHQYHATGQLGRVGGYGPRHAFDTGPHSNVGVATQNRPARTDETAYLQAQARSLKASLAAIESRLAQLGREPDSEAGSPKTEES
jgi:hypothetical protein